MLKYSLAMISRALISVSDKTGIVEFARFLNSRNIEILSTGGTAKLLKENNIPVRDVSEYTGFPEMFEGRVKTLHPKIHGGLLFLRENGEHQKAADAHGILPIDLIVVNLYPFEKTIEQEGVSLEEAIENIDIGGPSMLRSGAKNFRSVTVLCDSNDYDSVRAEIEKEGNTTLETREKLAAKAFARTAEYDIAIARFLDDDFFALSGRKVQDLRYGENPHQAAAFYRVRDSVRNSLATAKKLQGKELSFNNILDANAALAIILEFVEEPAAATVIKHLTPCGSAVAPSVEEAFDKAFQGDTVSAFGGVVAFTREVSEELARKLSELFLEVIIAPSFSPEAQKVLAQKKNVRLLQTDELKVPKSAKEIRSVRGGVLVQDFDLKELSEADLSVVTKVQPTPEQVQDMLFAWKICKHVKSNAIVLARNKVTTGVGAGQTSRVDAAYIAVKKAGERSRGSVCASDAFFPFPDAVETLAHGGITAIIQPGGSRKDDEVIEKCDELGIAMTFTGVRAFLH